ncbi:MAG: hypothetical protein ACQKBV_04905 [Puniceicoccales bacterium]
MRKTLPLLLLASCLVASALPAVQVQENALTNKRLFGIEMPTNLQSFYGRHDRINSVSLQEYMAGPYSVTEVAIDMAGSPLQLRIYHTELAQPQQVTAAMPNEAASRAGHVPPAVQKIIDKGRDEANSSKPPVIKDYPTTTHAKTIEFRVETKKELEQFYRLFVAAYTQNDVAGAADEADSEAESHKLGGAVFLFE